jgi:hypothetical protein
MKNIKTILFLISLSFFSVLAYSQKLPEYYKKLPETYPAKYYRVFDNKNLKFNYSDYAKTLVFSDSRKQELIELRMSLLNASFNSQAFLDSFTKDKLIFKGYRTNRYESLTLAELEFYELILMLKDGKEISSRKLDRFINTSEKNELKSKNTNWRQSEPECKRIGISLKRAIETKKWSLEKYDELLKESMEKILSADEIPFKYRDSGKFYNQMDEFRGYLKKFATTLKEDEYYTIRELESFWYESLKISLINNFIKDDYEEISLLDKGSVLFDKDFTIIKFNLEAFPSPIKSETSINFLDINNLFYPISESHRAIYKKGSASLQNIKHENFSGLKEDLINTGEFPYFLVASYFDERVNKLLKSEPNFNCDDLVDLINFNNELQVAINLSRMSISHTNQISNYVLTTAKEIEDMELRYYRQVLPFVDRYVESAKQRMQLGVGIYKESDYLSMIEKQKKASEKIDWVYRHMKYLIDSSTSIQLKEETIQLHDDVIKGEIIQLGEFVYFRDLDKKKYAYFYNSKWESLEKFHNKIDDAFDLLKENLNTHNSIIPGKIKSITLPVLQKQLSNIIDREDWKKNIESFRPNNFLKIHWKSMLESIKREYCNNLADLSKRIYISYIPSKVHLLITPEEANYFGTSIIDIKTYAELYFEHADRYGLPSYDRFAIDMKNACLTEL